MQISILAAWSVGGGGNLFLATLQRELKQRGVWVDNIAQADVVLCNSHHLPMRLLWLKWRYPNKIFLHRIDGPMSAYTQRADVRDAIVGLINRAVADATIYQSRWSRENNESQMVMVGPVMVIGNATDPLLFNRGGKSPFYASRPIRLVAVSWSHHSNKGARTLQWLDNNLDFHRYSMQFIGRSPVQFINIKSIGILPPAQIALALKAADIFIFPSRIEACSNALLEALHCGLPVVAFNGSSNPELVGRGGELFGEDRDIPALLQKITDNYAQYIKNIKTDDIHTIADKYMALASTAIPKRRTSLVLAMAVGQLAVIQMQAILAASQVSLKRFVGKLLGLIKSITRTVRFTWFVRQHFRKEFSSLKPGDIAIDCGANVGEITAQLVHRGARVYSFEPNPDAFRRLVARFGNNKQVTCFPHAVGIEDATINLYMHKRAQEDPVKWSVGASTLPAKDNIDSQEYMAVPLVDLANFIKGLGRPVKLLKIDIEGAEYGLLTHLILSGAIKNIGAVLVETHVAKIPALLPEHRALQALIAARGLTNIRLDWT